MNLSNIMSTELKKIDYEKTANIIVLSAVFLFAFTRFLYPPLHGISKFFIGLGGIYLLVKNPSDIRKDPVFLLFYAALAIQIVSWLSMVVGYPDRANDLPKLDKIGKLFFFIPIAWWLKDNNRYIFIALVLAVIGFICAMFTHSSVLSEVFAAVNGTRVDFGIKNAQHPSMFFGVIFIFCVFYAFYINKTKTNLTLFIIFFGISIFGIIATQTRQTILALIISSFIFIIFSITLLLKKRKLHLKENALILITVIILCFITVYSVGTNNRASKSISTFTKFSKNLPDYNSFKDKEEYLAFIINKRLKNDSAGIRLQLWLSAIPWILEKPFLGWDADGESYAVRNSNLLNSYIKEHFGHMHNFFFCVLLTYGFLGLSLILLLYIWILIAMYKIRKKMKDGDQWFLLAVFFISYWLVINNFEAFNTFWPGVFVHNLVLACLYTKYLYNKDKKAID